MVSRRELDAVLAVQFGVSGQFLPHAVNLIGESADVAAVQSGRAGGAEAAAGRGEDDFLVAVVARFGLQGER
jgi:hypothetical protein